MQNNLVDGNNKMIYNCEDILVKYFNTQNGKLIKIIREYITTQICCISDSIFLGNINIFLDKNNGGEK